MQMPLLRNPFSAVTDQWTWPVRRFNTVMRWLDETSGVFSLVVSVAGLQPPTR